MSRRAMRAVAYLAALPVFACERQEPVDIPATAMAAVREAEDARGAGPEGLQPIQRALRFPHPVVRHGAVRAVGRLERPDLIPWLIPALSDSSQTVRVEAVNAIGQAAFDGGWGVAFETLTTHLQSEKDPAVRGVYGQTLGRLPYPDADSHEAAERVLVELLSEPAAPAPAESVRLLALARGFESLARLGTPHRALSSGARALLARLTEHGLAGPEPAGLARARIRRVALMAYLASGPAPDSDVVERALHDPDDEVRRIAARGLAALPHSADRLATALADPAPRVRWEAIRIAGALVDRVGCKALLDGTRDPDPHVRHQSIDLLSEPCPGPGAQLARLLELTAAPPDSAEWHTYAHAVAALAELAPGDAGPATMELARHRSPFARAWGTRAATARRDTALLQELASDSVANVREAALRGWSEIAGHDVDSAAITQLDSEDPQLVMTAARALEGTPDPARASPALVAALERFTRLRQETSRDVRLALLDRIAELADAELADRLRPLLSDFDPRVAWRAAEILSLRTDSTLIPEPQPLPRAPLPSLEEITRLDRSTIVLDMGNGREIAIRLYAGLAPTNAARFARLAARGDLDGLTFHRVAPNFVVQGGSPRANEYAGHGSYTRDELGLVANWRGTVGVSTRGRDTGDGQIFVNLVDNLRLDHDYTVFGEVVRGMDVVDSVLEGAVIQAVKIDLAPAM